MIYLFDKEEQLIKVVRRNAIKSALQKYALTTDNYVSDRLTVEMKALNDDEFEKVEYMAIQSMEDTHLFHYFYIAQKSTKGEISTFTGVQSGIEELRKTPVFDKRPKNTPAKPVINELLQGTNWQARFVADTTNHSTNFYYTSVFDALKKICKVWGLEMQFFVEMNSNGLGARYIDFKKKIGEAVGKRVVYGHNALEILKEVERTNIFTALIGRGKGEQVSSAEESGKDGDGYGRKITFEDVVWSKAKGDPLDKPKGQKYLEIPEMTRVYGIKNSDGSMRPKIGFTEFSEEEDPNELIKLTYQTLTNSARPQLTLKTSSVYLKGVKIGDTIRVVRHDKKLDYDTRIFEITFNRLNDQSSDIKLGDQIGESSSSKVQAVADKAVEEFINNEFNSFIENLPDFIKTADGFNTNWYSTEDPVKKYPKKVMVNDIWYKPDPEHEGHKIMYRWTGEVWEEILRTYNEVSLREAIEQKFNELKQAIDQQSTKTEQQINDALSKSGLGKLADDAKKIAEQTKGELETIKQQNQTEKNELNAFKERVQADLDGKPSITKVTELIDGVKEQFTVSTVGGPNLIRNTAYKENLKFFNVFPTEIARIGNHPFYFNNSKPILILSGEGSVFSNRFLLEKNTDYTLNFRCFNSSSLTSYDVFISGRRNGETKEVTISKQLISGKKSSNSELETVSIKFNSGDIDNAFLRIDNNGSNSGQSELYIAEIDLYKGTQPRPWQPAPEDQDYLVTQAQAEFEKTAQGLKTKLDTISTNFNPDGTTSEKFNRFLETKTAEGISRERAEFGNNYVAKNTYNEKISEIEQKFNRTDGQLTQFAAYKNGLDGQYATITKELADNKRAYSDFARTSDVFVQAFGTVGSEISSNISRMLLNDQIFQTEVGKYSSSGGPNMLKNSRADDGLKYWNGAPNKLSFTAHQFYLNGQKRMFQLSSGAVVNSPRFIFKKNTDYMLNMLAFDANTARFKIEFRKRKKNSANQDYDEIQTIFDKTGNPAFSSERALKRSFKFNTGDFDNGYLLFIYDGNPSGWSGLFMTELDFYEGSADRLWQPSPDDLKEPIEAVRTQVTQLNNSYSIRSLTSAGDVLGQLNLNPDGSIRINEGLLSIGEKTYIKDGVIKKSMIGEAQIETAHIKEIDASQARIINLNASSVNSGTFVGLTYKGGRIESLDETLSIDLNRQKIRLGGDNVGIVREDVGYPTQFIKYQSTIEDGRKHAKTIIGSNRNGSENWKSVSFAGIVIDNNSNNGVDNIFQYGDYNNMRHASSDDGWNFGVVSQTLTPGVWNKNSEIWCRHFVIPKKTKSDTDAPTEFIRLDESVAALWKLWAHAIGQVTMTTAMTNKVKAMLDAFSYSRDHIN